MASARYTKQPPAKFAPTHNYYKAPTPFEQGLFRQEDDIPPPRKEKYKQEKQKKKKKKRTYDETADFARNSGAGPSSGRNAAGTSDNNAITVEDDEDAEDEEDEADDRKERLKRPKKKLKRQGTSSAPVSTTNSPKMLSSHGPSRLILRLPNNNPSTAKHVKKDKKKQKHSSPVRLNGRHPNSLARTVTTSPVSSVSSDHTKHNTDIIPDFSLAPTGFQLTYASESSDEFSDLIEDDEDVEGAEEAYLIADKLKKMERKARKGTQSPNLTQSHGSDNESMEVIGADRDSTQANGESVLFEIARIRRMSDSSNRPKISGTQDEPVTWSGAEDSDLDNLDELLGLTTDDTAALIGNLPEESEDGKTIRFEDFLAADDGDASDSSAGDSDDSDDSDSMKAEELDADDTDADNEHISTTREMMQNGGFVFYKAGPDDSTEDEVSDDCPSVEDDGGDTTDVLDDTDHLGLIRFGIEAADEDDEDAEEALQTAMLDRNLTDARNMGLSISIDALAEQPEMVVAKTAKSLGVSAETAAKILASVGMSILMNGGHSATSEVERPEASKKKDKGKGRAQPPVQPRPVVVPTVSSSAGQTSVAPDVPTASTSTAIIEGTTEQAKKHEPILGDFEPAGEADLCVVVAQSSMPAPSPFSARKRRRPRTFTNGSPSAGSNHRGQSVVSSLSSQSFTSALPYHSNSSEEPHYNIILDLDDLVDSSMLPSGMTDVSEEDEEMDDTASMSTALGGVQAVGDTSRWNRVPIGAFRSANPQGTHYSPLATAFFSGTRDAAVANNLSFHGGVAISTKHRKNRYIPVSPVLFPVAQSLKAISQAKSRKERRHEKKQKRVKKEPVDGDQTATYLQPFSISTSGQGTHSLPSDGLSHYVSPLFSGVASGIHIPPLSLGDPQQE